MSIELNTHVARESIEAAFRCDWEALRNTYADDAVMHAAAFDEPVRGADAIVALWRGCHEEERDLEVEILSVIAGDDMAAVEFRHKGIVNQPLPGIPDELMGKRLEVTEVHICKMRDGKITAITIYSGECNSPDSPIKRVWVTE